MYGDLNVCICLNFDKGIAQMNFDLKRLEREAYIKGDTAAADLYDRILQALNEPCDCDDTDYHLYTDDEYEELLDDFRDLETRYDQLKARMEGLEK